MSTKHYLLLLLIGSLCLCPLLYAAQSEGNDPVFALEIRLKSAGKKVHHYQVILSQGGKGEDTVTVKSGKEVYVTLSRNQVYYLTFHKEGMKDRTLVVNTDLPSSATAAEIFTLNFEVEMQPDIPGDAAAQLPLMYLKYDSTEDEFALATHRHE